MGKPYKIELASLAQTYQWALTVPVDRLRAFVNSSFNTPLLAVGSGGSLTAAHMAAMLHQATGAIAKAVTPLELISSIESIRSSNVLILSAGGSNSDIQSAFRFAATAEPKNLLALCMRTESPLASIASGFRFTSLVDFDLPVGKDGFLATNSLLGFVTLLTRAYQHLVSNEDGILHSLPNAEDIAEQLNNAITPLLHKDTWIVLYGKWGLPAAVDVESKFTEAAIGHVQIADYRNFAHGRHHWLAKRSRETGIVALITPEEKSLAERTIGLIPSDIPFLRLTTDETGPKAALDLLVKMIHLVGLAGSARGIDPGRPGVPEFGRRIYNLKSSTTLQRQLLPSGMKPREAAAILRKSKRPTIKALRADELSLWKEAYILFTHKLEQAFYGALVLDYDGTLCDLKERYKGPPEEIAKEIIRLLESGIIIGIATGRGQSVRTDLQKLLPNKYWGNVLIGYYNGSDITPLTNNDRPDKNGSIDTSLNMVKTVIERNSLFSQVATYECRPKQITVEPITPVLWEKARTILFDIINKELKPGVRVLESSHSIDIIAPGVSKLALVQACERATKQRGSPETILCIGDRGEWPGNDYELLSTPFSLSVDTVSPSEESCWNLSLAGHRGVQATLAYLRSLSSFLSNSFTFRLE